MADKVIDIARQHPVYTQMLPLWQFYRDSYKGGRDYIRPISNIVDDTGEGSYLYPHDFELKKPGKFTNRHRRSFYPNYCRLPVNTFTKYIFSGKQEIRRDFEDDNYNTYIDNIDLKNTHINSFMRKVATNMLVYGNTYILVDKIPPPPEINSLDEQKSAGIYRAYANMITPEMVTDWSIDPLTNRYNWVLIKTKQQNDHSPVVTRKIETIYYLWTKDEVFIINEEGHLVPPNETLLSNPISHGIGEVPIINCVYSDVDDDGKSESMLADIAKINREIYNVYSLYQEELYKVAFAQLMKAKSKDDYSETSIAETNEYVSNSMVLEYPEGSDPYSYLTPPIQALVEKRAYINDLVIKILQMSNLQKQDGIDGTMHTSGIAMAFAYNDTWYTVSQMASRLEECENNMWSLVQAYDRSETPNAGLLFGDINSIYPTEFDVFTDDMKMKWHEQFKRDVNGSPTASTLADMDFITLRFRQLDEKLLKTIEGEFEASNEKTNQKDLANNEAVQMTNSSTVTDDLEVEETEVAESE